MWFSGKKERCESGKCSDRKTQRFAGRAMPAEKALTDRRPSKTAHRRRQYHRIGQRNGGLPIVAIATFDIHGHRS
jgi:hypothetical protein